MKTNLKISHTMYPNGIILKPYYACEEKKNAPLLIIIILLIMFAYIVLTGVLLLTYLFYNYFTL
jgi:hypothetical protein